MNTLVVKVGGAVAADAIGELEALLEQGYAVCVVHGAGPQITLEMERAGIPVEFVDGRRVTSALTAGASRSGACARRRKVLREAGGAEEQRIDSDCSHLIPLSAPQGYWAAITLSPACYRIPSRAIRLFLKMHRS